MRVKWRPGIAAIVAFAAFCGLSVLSRLSPLAFILVVLSGIVFPLMCSM